MKRIAVIVGRFQVPELHEGHKHLIETALFNEEEVCIFLGVSDKYFSLDNPLPYFHRKGMILEEFPEVKIHPLADMPADEFWVRSLDNHVKQIYNYKYKIYMYGSRDSFIDCYHDHNGIYQTIMLHDIPAKSGTQSRNEVKTTLINSTDFRKGIIYTVTNSKKDEK